MPTVNKELTDKAILHSLRLSRFAKAEAQRVRSFIRSQVLPDIREQLAGKMSGNLTDWKKARLEALHKANTELLERKYSDVKAEILKDLSGLSKVEMQALLADMRKTMPKDIGVKFDGVSPETLRTIVSGTRVNGRFIEDWLDDLSKAAAVKVEQGINVGIAQGQTTDEIVDRIIGTVAANYKDGDLDTITRNAEAIVRTSANNISNETRKRVFNENSDIIKGYRYVATLDSRTTVICASLDGKEFDLDDTIKPPLHWNCRSTIVPIIKSFKELGIDADELEPSTRASVDGQVPEKLTYGQWLKGQSEKTQNEVLGVKGAELFREGKAKIEDFVDANYRPLTLGELEASIS